MNQVDRHKIIRTKRKLTKRLLPAIPAYVAFTVFLCVLHHRFEDSTVPFGIIVVTAFIAAIVYYIFCWFVLIPPDIIVDREKDIKDIDEEIRMP